MKILSRYTLLIGLLAFVAFLGKAELVNPVSWNQSIEKGETDKEGVMSFTATIQKNWHIYGLNLPEGGPNPTTFEFIEVVGGELVGEVVPSSPAVEEFDSTFNLPLSWWETTVTFRQKFRLNEDSKGFRVKGTIRYQACSLADGSCIPPQKEAIDMTFGSPVEAPVSDAVTNVVSADVQSSSLWAPADFSKVGKGVGSNVADASWLYIFVWGFIGGLLALLTPCVWPMIPLTVSFFLKKSSSRRRSIGDALTYGVAIVVIFLVLGLAVTVVFGASKLNDLATNAVFNLIFFALLVVFAISFFGAFEIKLPASWSNRMDSRADRTTGVLSIFFMAFTLVLVSFSCTGPIIGTLLVEAASQGSYVGPAVGMGAFALALAIPFTLCAVFPSLLKELPRSGGWLNSVKVILGFLELALSLKFLSVADLAYGWGLLDREVFISLWVAIFVLLSLYLLGKFRFSHDSELENVGITRFFLSMFSLSFAIYLVPGLWGAPLKAVSAFVPPLFTQDFNLYGSEGFKSFDDYDEGMKYASDNNLPVLIDFSGYGCVNCRKMEGAVFDTEEVSGLIKDNFVLITLMVDDKHKLPTPIEVVENGKSVMLETVGEKWSYLQRSKFNASIQPYYVVLDGSGQPLTPSYSYDENVARFVEWLQSGLKNFKQK
ncbi:MAG: thioredoxin family protein [Paramuribaculum sp.]|nr:thioredoxin family protein [Paramuribaculum sp.]